MSLCIIQVGNRDLLLKAFAQANIEVAIHYPCSVSSALCYLDSSRGDIDTKYLEKIVSLPIFPEIIKSEQDDVVDVLSKSLGNLAC